MKSLFKSIIIICLIASCQSNSEKTNKKNVSQKLVINYTGDVDVVQFKMFQGLSEVLKYDSCTESFEGILEIPNLTEAIFTYDIVVHKKDKSGQMLELHPKSNLIKLNQNAAIEKGNRFLWIGKKRNGDYLETEELTGSLTTKSITSQFFTEERKTTIYTPKEIDSNTPIFYFTDGSVVNDYAPYVDKLISSKKIKPIKLIGIHSSLSKRYEEYVQGDKDNELFRKHENFVYNEVMGTIEKEIKNWNGKRYFYGFSNGAAFCMHAGLNYPNLFEEIVAFSTADYISSFAQMINPISFDYEKYPKFYMGAGRYESSFNGNVEFSSKMKNKDIQVDFKEFVSGHDYNVWRIEFLEFLENRFKK